MDARFAVEKGKIIECNDLWCLLAKETARNRCKLFVVWTIVIMNWQGCEQRLTLKTDVCNITDKKNLFMLLVD